MFNIAWFFLMIFIRYSQCSGIQVLHELFLQDSSFKSFTYLMFKYRSSRMCYLVLIFKFLVSAGPTCSALPVNAKDVLSIIRFRRELLFYCFSSEFLSC